MFLGAILVLAGLLLLYYGAEYLVTGSSRLALSFGVRPLVVGLTVVAFATSMPELMVSLFAATRGASSMAAGNIIGSNIVNIFLIIGISSILSPLTITRATILTAAPFMVAMTVLFLLFIRSRWQLERLEAILFLLLYAIFLGYIFFTSSGTL